MFITLPFGVHVWQHESRRLRKFKTHPRFWESGEKFWARIRCAEVLRRFAA